MGNAAFFILNSVSAELEELMDAHPARDTMFKPADILNYMQFPDGIYRKLL